MTRKGGVENIEWSWKAAIFALPVPFTRRRIPVEMGPSSSVWVMLLVAAAVMRSKAMLSFAMAYQALILCTIRAMCRTWSNLFLLGYAAAVAAPLLL